MSMLQPASSLATEKPVPWQQQNRVEPVLRHVNSTEALLYNHPRVPSLLVRARALV